MDMGPCVDLLPPPPEGGIHVDRPPTGLRTTREAPKRQSFRLEVPHHHMSAQAAQGLSPARNGQAHEGICADASRVAAK